MVLPAWSNTNSVFYQAGRTRIIYAWSTQDPDGAPHYHGKEQRGSKILELLSKSAALRNHHKCTCLLMWCLLYFQVRQNTTWLPTLLSSQSTSSDPPRFNDDPLHTSDKILREPSESIDKMITISWRNGSATLFHADGNRDLDESTIDLFLPPGP